MDFIGGLISVMLDGNNLLKYSQLLLWLLDFNSISSQLKMFFMMILKKE